MRIYQLSIFLALLTLIIGCNSGGKMDAGMLTIAKGKPGEIILVMDSGKWEGTLGDQVREVFMPVVEGLPRPESMFTIRYIDPRKLNSVLKGVKNMIFITTLDSHSHGSKILNNYFTSESRKKIKSNSNLFLSTDQDVFARGQEVMYLFGKDDSTLINHLKTNKEKLQGHFNSIERARLMGSMYKAKEVKGIEELMQREYQNYLRVPFGYQLVQHQEGFLWIRRIDTQVDRDIFIGYKPYKSEDDLKKENVLNFRDSLTRQFIFEDPEKPNTFVTLQSYIPVIQREVNFNNKFAIESRGLWRTNNNSMGGPFLSYTFVDEELNRLYYLEGFVYSPGKKQREMMREIEVTLSTFKTKLELEKAMK